MATPRTVAALVDEAATRHPDREALVDEDRTLTYAQLATEVDRAARGLLAAGVVRGTRVGLWAPNISEWVLAALGALRIGATLVPINTRYKGHEAGDLLERSHAELLCTVTGFLDTDYVELLRRARGPATDARPVEGLPELRDIVVLRGTPPAGTRPLGALLAAGDDVDAARLAAAVEAVAPEDPSDIMFTSGTTGRPKGVVATHAQTVELFSSWAEIVGLTSEDRYLIVNPFFHTFGYKAGMIACLVAGATMLPHAVFDPDEVLQRIPADDVTVLPGPPTLYQSLLGHPDLAAHDLSGLRLAVTGAASIPVSLIRRMREELGFDTVLTAYGLTESTGVVTMCRDGDDDETVATTSGRAVPGVEVAIVDDEGREVPVGTAGEVVVRGYNVMHGYLEDPEATAAAIDADGWLHTGDVGVLDERGYLDITDRKKDVFIVGGFNAYPAEIENALLEHEGVAQVAVVGVPHDRLGEVGHAFVVPRPGHQVDPDALISWARDRMANFKVPRGVDVVASLPVNASGKVLKHELRPGAPG